MTAKTPAVPTAADARTFLTNFGHTVDALRAMKDEDVLKLHTSVTGAISSLIPAPVVAAAPVVDNKTDAAKAEDAKDKGKDDAEEDANGKKKKPAMNTVAAVPQTTEQYLEAAPPGIRESIEAGMRMHATHKTNLITKISANSRNKFTAAQLQGFDVPTLENLAELAVVPDYSGMAPAGGGGLQANVQPAENPNFAPTPPRLFTANAAGDALRGVMKAAS